MLQIIAVDIDRAAFNVGLPIIERAGVVHKVEFIESEALLVLDKLVENDENEGSFDFAFVDADEINYESYHERLMRLVRVGGIIANDNTLWGGTVTMNEESVSAFRKPGRAATIEFNKSLVTDSRIQICHASIGDGITICRRIR